MTRSRSIGRIATLAAVFAGVLLTSPLCAFAAQTVALSPGNGAKGVNPDTRLILTFEGTPVVGTSGQIRIYDAADNRLVDTLDLSIPPGPTLRADASALNAPYTPVPYEYRARSFTNANTKPGTPSGAARAALPGYQMTIIGGFTDAFHFYPVIIHGNVATIYPHNNLLEYGKTYSVQIDPGVIKISGEDFAGITAKSAWTFETKKTGPPPDADRLVVSADGSGHFDTVQGAIDSIPDNNPRRVTIFIRNGTYEEIVYFRNKTNITFLGEDRDRVIVQYANNEVFNPHPPDVSTNEMEGTFPSRRAAFMGDHSNDIHFVNLTIRNTAKGQAEGLLVNGDRNILSHVNIVGSGDALQVNGRAYFADCSIVGDGDTILGRGAAFFERCRVESGGPFMWIRNTAANHGNVFVNSHFIARGAMPTVIARSPVNRGKSYPNAEAVLIDCSLSGVSAEGWGPIGGDASAVRFWEHNSTNESDGKPVDTSMRHPGSRQLTREKDAETIANYRDPAFVLGGWRPAMTPLILSQPARAAGDSGEFSTLSVRVVAIPPATYQWLRNGVPIKGATDGALKIEPDGSEYSVVTTNTAGTVTSQPIKVSRVRR